MLPIQTIQQIQNVVDCLSAKTNQTVYYKELLKAGNCKMYRLRHLVQYARKNLPENTVLYCIQNKGYMLVRKTI